MAILRGARDGTSWVVTSLQLGFMAVLLQHLLRALALRHPGAVSAVRGGFIDSHARLQEHLHCVRVSLLGAPARAVHGQVTVRVTLVKRNSMIYQHLSYLRPALKSCSVLQINQLIERSISS